MKHLSLITTAALGLSSAIALPAGAATGGSAPKVNYRVIKHDVALDIAKDGSFTRTVTEVVQPLTISGVQNESQVQIEYPSNFASVAVLSAYTETALGKKVNVAPHAIFSQSTPDALSAPFLSDGAIKNVVFPSVSPGAIIHIKYVEHFKHPFLPGIYAESDLLAPNVPVASEKISVTAPKSMPLHFHARGAWSAEQSANQSTHTVTATASQSKVDFPPSDTVDVTQYAPLAVISTAAGWKQVAKAYDKLSGPAMKVTPAIKKAATEAAAGATGEQAVSNAYHWVQKNIQSVGVDYDDAGFAPPSAAQSLARGIGDTNASAVLLSSMLKALGVQAAPVMMSTDQRFVPLPGATALAFDHFLVYVPKYKLYLDTSERFAGVGALPEQDAGRPALLTGVDAQLKKTPVPTPDNAVHRELQDMTLTANGVIASDSHIYAAGWPAESFRENFLSDQTGQRLQNTVEADYYGGGHTGVIKITDIKNRHDLDAPIIAQLKWRNSDAVIPGKEIALVMPAPGRISGELSSFVNQATQNYPSVLDPGTIKYAVHLRLPAGMKPQNLPKDEHFAAPFGSYSVHYQYANGVLDETRELKLNRFVVDPKAYPQLHKMALMAVNTDRRGLLFKKTAG